MKAIVCARYGAPDVLELMEIETPTPAGDAVLIRTCAASVNPLDRTAGREISSEPRTVSYSVVSADGSTPFDFLNS